MRNQNLSSDILLITFSEDLYKFHYALSMASTLRATERKVTVFITGYSCNYIRKEWEKYDINNIREKLKRSKMPTIKQLFLYCKELNVKFYYCSTALDYLEINISEITNFVDIDTAGLYSVINDHKDKKIIFI